MVDKKVDDEPETAQPITDDLGAVALRQGSHKPELLTDLVKSIDTLIRTHPYYSMAVIVKAADKIAAESAVVPRITIECLEGIAVEPVQPVDRAGPQETVGI